MKQYEDKKQNKEATYIDGGTEEKSLVMRSNYTWKCEEKEREENKVFRKEIASQTDLQSKSCQETKSCETRYRENERETERGADDKLQCVES